MKHKIHYLIAFVLTSILFTACGAAKPKIKLDELGVKSKMELQYAKQFSVEYLQDDYKLITIAEKDKFLLIPKGSQMPKVSNEITIIEYPIENVYMVAPSSMTFFDTISALDSITLTGTQQSAWYIENAKKAMEDGKIKFAGKYSEPDYELILANDTKLSIQSTMINHSPEVKEKLEDLGIPVLIDYSSYENHPLGRTEWIKLYGALLNKEKEAETFFNEQTKTLDEILKNEKTDKTVAFFYISSSGYVIARKSGDYISKMIELAGGEYIFNDLGDPTTATSTATLEMEEFYATAKDADYIIYNNTISDEIKSMKELLKLNSLLADFKAVKNNKVFATGKNLYQESTKIAHVINDMNKILTIEDLSNTELEYIYKLQ